MKLASFVFATILLLLFSGSSLSQDRPTKKKNTRPTDANGTTRSEKDPTKEPEKPVYFFEFEKAEFLVSKFVIAHDENGLGTITFRKKDIEEDFTEPLTISKSVLKKLRSYWEALEFLESTGAFQSERDYSHLGTMRLRMKRDDRERQEEFNWTDNMDVRNLAEEYRKIGTQLIWVFDFDVARKNQPLLTPRMMTALDSHIRRNAISDPWQMVPYLQELSDDERIPLIARNHASRLLKKIEKKKVPDAVEPSPNDQ